MRLDKYLKVSRIIKRRTVANDACDAGRVLVNGKAARASYDVKEGDILELQLGSHAIKAQILSINEYARKGEADEMYKILSDEPK
ncbi:MAG TPA: RNA-binding S4 domain-containing protein [Caproiciproducens sp.]|nr:RNA-binding S4 domain-containing protein [Caproiciproducens sp.]